MKMGKAAIVITLAIGVTSAIFLMATIVMKSSLKIFSEMTTYELNIFRTACLVITGVSMFVAGSRNIKNSDNNHDE